MRVLVERIKNIYNDDDMLQMIAWYCIMFGLIVFPMQIRYAMLAGQIKGFAKINYLFIVAVCILFNVRNRRQRCAVSDLFMMTIWAICVWLMLFSNYKHKTAQSVLMITNCMLPILLVLLRFEQDRFHRIMKHFLCVFRMFILLLLVIAVVERISGDIILRTVNQWIASKEYTGYLGYLETDVWRFYSFWGHALTNATLFNMFFVLNDLYNREIGKRYPKLVYFAISLLGVLLCSSKTALVILLSYFLVSSYKSWKLLAGCAGVVVTFLLCGGFRIILQRFTSTSLTTGRFDAFGAYLQSGLKPLRFFCGYGTGAAYSKQLYDFRAGFEFPVLMEALDYGILFVLLWLGGMYIYVSYQILKQHRYMVWIGFSVVYVQYNTYNGLALSNQDSFMWLCVAAVLFIGLANMDQKNDKVAKNNAVQQKLVSDGRSVSDQPPMFG